MVTPEIALSVTAEAFGMAIGGLEDQVGEEMGMWEVRQTEEKGNGLFARKDVGAVFAGETVILKTPTFFVSKKLFGANSSPQAQTILNIALEQLPEKTRNAMAELAANDDGGAADIVLTNGITVKWPWAADVPELLAITPEVAVSR